MASLSIVSPVYGCESCLEELADRVAASLDGRIDRYELILVDDASPDGAWSRIRELASSRPWVRGLRLSRNFGQHAAISAGLQEAEGEWIAVMDCDLQDVPEELPRLLSKAMDDHLDVVFAQRTNRQDSWFKRLSSTVFFAFLSWLTGVRQDASTANFGVYRKNVVAAINAMPERERTFPLMVKWSGFKTGYLPVAHAARTTGKSGYSLSRLVKLAITIALSYSDKPLRLVAQSGIVFSLIAFAMVAMSIWKWLEGDIAVAGYTSVIASIWLVGGATMLSLGTVGLYIGQVYRNAQGRPFAIVAEKTGAGQ